MTIFKKNIESYFIYLAYIKFVCGKLKDSRHTKIGQEILCGPHRYWDCEILKSTQEATLVIGIVLI